MIIGAISNLIEEIKLLKIDNELNERFLRKNDDELLAGLMAATHDTENRKTKIQFAESVHEPQTKTNNVVPQTCNSSEHSRNTSSIAGSSIPSRSASSISSIGSLRRRRQPMSLSLVIKTNICQTECDVERGELNIFQQNMRSQFTDLLAEVEEIKLTTQDILYATGMFKDFVILKGRSGRTVQFR